MEVESVADSLDLVTAPALRKAPKDAGVSGLSGAKKAELMKARAGAPLPHPT